MNTKLLTALAAPALVAGLATAAPALLASASAAPAKAPVTVTIQGDDPYGYVTSPKAVCKAERVVKLWEQVGAKGGGDDVWTGLSDTTGYQGGKWAYSFGNPGLDDGTYYAKVKATGSCKAAVSRSIVIDREDDEDYEEF